MPDPPNFTVRLDRTNELSKSLQKLAQARVMIGIPADKERKTGGGSESRVDDAGTTIKLGNAALGYLHENGSPYQNIPPRPWLSPGVSQGKEQWMNYLRQAGTLALEGNTAGVERALNAAGISAVSAVKSRMVAGIPPPLSPRTIAARRRRSKGSSYRRKASTAVDVTPLIDTAQLLNAVTYVIRWVKR